MKTRLQRTLSASAIGALALAAVLVSTGQPTPGQKVYTVNVLHENGGLQYEVDDGSSKYRSSRIVFRDRGRNTSVYFTSAVGRFAVAFTGDTPMARLTYEGGKGEVVGGAIKSDVAKKIFKYGVVLEVTPGQFVYEDPEMDFETGP